MKSQRFDIHVSIERHVPLIACFSLFLIIIFGSVSYSSNAYADDMMGMPSPQDAPATTDALTAGGGPGNGDDDNDNNSGDDTGGSQDSDDDNDNDNDKDNDKDDEPIPKDAPATADTLTAKKIECPKGQEVTLFSTTCKPAEGGSDSTQGTTSAATVCPTTSPTPTSHSTQDEASVTKAVWSSNNNDYKIKTEEEYAQKNLLHRIVTPERPGVTEENPALLALCTRQPVEVTDPDGTATTYDPDGTVTVKKPDGTETTHNPDRTKNIKKLDANGVAIIDAYNANNQLTSSIMTEPITGRKVLATEYLPGTGARTSETTFNPFTNKAIRVQEFDPASGQLKSHTTYHPGTDKPSYKWEVQFVKACSNCPLETREVHTNYKADGSGVEQTIDKDGKRVSIKVLDRNGNIIETK